MVVDIKKYEEESKIRHIDDIVKNPLNVLRIRFSEKFLSAEAPENITEEYVREVHKELEKFFKDMPDGKETFARHQENFEHFLKTGEPKNPLTLDSEESLFYWGTVLGLLAVHPEMQENWDDKHRFADITKSTLWKRIEKSSYMQINLQKHAYLVKRSVNNPKTKMVYGAPGGYPNIRYCCSTNIKTGEKIIFDDMLWTLLTGVDASGTAIGHEIAHSEGSQHHETPRMIEINKEHEEAKKQLEDAKQRNNKDEVIELTRKILRLNLEYKMRYRFHDELENMFANRFAVTRGGDFDRAHLNELEASINVGEKYFAGKKIGEVRKILQKDPMARIQHVKDIARNSFFCNNGLVEGEPVDWNKIGLFPQLLDGIHPDGEEMSPLECFMEIRRICNEFEEKQPSQSLENTSPQIYRERMTELSLYRMGLVDEFFDKFVAHHMEELYQKQNEELEQILQSLQQQQQQQQQGGQGQGQPQPNQQGQGQGEGQPQPNQQGQGQGEGQPQPNQQGQQNGQQQGGQGQQNGQQQGGQGQQDGQQQGGQGQPQSGQPHPGDDPNGDRSWQDMLPTIEDMQLPNVKPKNPLEGMTDEEVEELLSKSSNVDDLAQEYENEHQEEIEEQKQKERELREARGEYDGPRQRKRTSGDAFSRIKHTEAILISKEEMMPSGNEIAREYREGSFSSYQKYVAQFTAEIAVARTMIKEIITQKKLEGIEKGVETRRPVRAINPGRLQKQRVLELKKKMSRGEQVTIRDFDRFDKKRKCSDTELSKEVEISPTNIAIVIDSSGSMCGTPFDNAIKIACILYEAAREFDEVNLYVYAMGDPEPVTIAHPDMSTKKISEMLDAARKLNGMGCSDRLIPAVIKALSDITDSIKLKSREKGSFTHIFSITDGGNNDYGGCDGYQVNDVLEKMIRENPQITMDSIFIGEVGGQNYTKPLIHRLQDEGITQMDYVDVPDGDAIPTAVRQILKERMRHSDKDKKGRKIKRINSQDKESMEAIIKEVQTSRRR